MYVNHITLHHNIYTGSEVTKYMVSLSLLDKHIFLLMGFLCTVDFSTCHVLGWALSLAVLLIFYC